MSDKEKIMYIFQLIFGYPILAFAVGMIYLDVAGYVDIEKFGYAFFAGIIVHFLNFFFRKAIKQ